MGKFAIQGGLPANYNLGRGRLYLYGERGKTNSANSLLGDTAGWRDIGNVTQFTISQGSETKDHTSYLTGIQTIDKSIAVSTKLNISFATDEMSANNLAAWFGGTLISGYNGSSILNPAKLASDNAFYLTTPNMYFQIPSTVANHVYDLWYDLQMTAPVSHGAPLGGQTLRAYDFEPNASQAITVRKNPTDRSTADGTLLTEGTHYVLDRRMGLIKFLAAANFTTGGGDYVQIKWAAGTSGLSGIDTFLHTFGLLEHSGKTVAIKFVQENANDNDNSSELVLFQVKLKPEGDFSGISDEWGVLTFSGAAEALTENIPFGASPYGKFTMRDSYST